MQETVSKLVALMEAAVREDVPTDRPPLRLVQPVERPAPEPAPERWLEPGLRRWHIKMISHMRGWNDGLRFLVDQACGSYEALERLSDDDLLELRRELDRARDCAQYNMASEDAGFVRSCG